MRSPAVSNPLPPPTKGVRPQTDGVAGQLLDIVPASVVFGSKRFKQSPYDPLLVQLKRAGAGKYLRFEDVRARASVCARAKKLGIKVLFGEEGSILWVCLAEVQTHSEGMTEPSQKKSQADLALEAIGAKRHTAGEILTWMRSNGSDGLGIAQVDGILRNLARAGKVALKPLRPGVDQPERWVLA